MFIRYRKYFAPRLRPVFLVATLLWAASCYGLSGRAGPFHFNLVTNPSVLTTGKADLIVTVTDAEGRRLDGLTVRTLVKMPGMNMGEREQTARPTGQTGTYDAPAILAMDGTYEASLFISGSAGNGSTVLSLSTGEDTSSTGKDVMPYVLWGSGVLFVVLAAWGLRKMDRQALRRAIGPSLLLAVTIGLAVWAVKTFRRPGSMTPIEAQAMAMDTPAPPGAIPVRLATVHLAPFVQTVRYSGQTAPYSEQSVVARVTGTILSMPFYVGDRVHKGDLLARLDTKQLDPEVAMRTAAISQASQSVAEASSGVDEALRQVDAARSDLATAKSANEEAIAMVSVAREVVAGAEAGVRAAQENADAMADEAKSAQADLEYAQATLKRDQTLFDAGVIPAQQLDRSRTDEAKAAAAYREASAKIGQSRAAILAAEASERQARAELGAAQTRMKQAQSAISAKQASLATVQASVKVAVGRVGEQDAAVRVAKAELASANVQRGFAELRAEVDGSVVERELTPGTVVDAGQTLLKVDQITPLRIQADVAQEDLARIHLGNLVRTAISGHTLTARVTAIQPSVAAGARTGMVEALIPNVGGRYKPGEFVSVEIAVGETTRAATVPISAVIWPTAAWPKPMVWVANEATAKRVEVTLGGQEGDEVAVLAGLKEGDKVILTPPTDMLDDAEITVVSDEDTTPPISHIRIMAAGFVPAQISVAPDKPIRLAFTRMTTQTCATAVLFPSLGITQELPMNKEVEVDLPALPSGHSLSFECRMHMLKGQVTAK